MEEAGVVIAVVLEDSFCWMSTLPLELGEVVDASGAAEEDATFSTAEGEDTGTGLGEAGGGAT